MNTSTHAQREADLLQTRCDSQRNALIAYTHPVVDAHAHIYPEKIASRAVESVGDFYLIKMDGNGTADHLCECHAQAGITHAIVHSVAVKPKNVESINTFIAAECAKHPNFIGFMTMHPDYENPEAEIERALKLGLKGMKIHPDTQYVNADDPRMMRIYEMIEGRMSLIIHTGDYRYDYSHPRRVKNICRTFPKLRVDASHFGGWSIPDLAIEYMEDENCFMDCSSSFFITGMRRAKELINIYGADRILFGSDFPMWSPADELRLFESMELSEEDTEKILWRNAQRFIGEDITMETALRLGERSCDAKPLNGSDTDGEK